MRARDVVLAFLVVAVVVAPVFAEGPTWKHSGTVLAVNPDTGTIVLGEVGPWARRNGETVVTERKILVTAETHYVMARRVDGAPSGFRRDFVEQPIEGTDLESGDYVTVECEHRGSRMIASKVTVVSFETP